MTDPIDAIHLGNESVQLFTRLFHQLKTNPQSRDEVLTQWGDYIRAVEPRTKIVINGQEDPAIAESLSSLSRVLHEAADIVEVNAMDSSGQLLGSSAGSPPVGRARLGGGLARLPRHMGTSPNSPRTTSPTTTQTNGQTHYPPTNGDVPEEPSPLQAPGDSVSSMMDSPSLAKAPAQRGLEGGLSADECVGFALE